MVLPYPTQTTASSPSSITTTSSQSHLYPQVLQLKLYQAFIFSIPILFSIILFLLFYLFYLKRRASTLSSSPPILIRRRSHNQASAPSTYVSSAPCPMDLKGDLKEMLQIILFDEELRKKDSQCCVCLGEFEMEEELLQVQSCKHVFHVHCIHHWLHNNTTCPLCRCLVIPISTTTKIDSNNPAPVTVSSTTSTEPAAQQLQQHHSIIVSHHSPGIVSLELRQNQQQQMDNNVAPNVTAAVGEESPSTAGTGSSTLRESGCSSSTTSNRDSGDSVTIHIPEV